MSHRDVHDRVRGYYEGKLRTHGPTPAGVDWNSQASQEQRFRELARLWNGDPDASLLDYGCGYGAMAGWVRQHGHRGPYVGFDLSPEMVASAREQHGALPGCRFVHDPAALAPADFAAASGVFNVRMDTPDARWRAYVLDTIAELARLGRRGFAFNALTSYSDPDKRRDDLHYADPLELFDHCKRTYSRFVTLLHDYPLWEFTVIVRHQP